MYTIATRTHAAEMTLLDDNGCCTTTFPYCTRRPRVNMAKSKTRLKNFAESDLFLRQQFLKFFTAIFFNRFSCFLLQRLIQTYLYARMAFSITSRLH